MCFLLKTVKSDYGKKEKFMFSFGYISFPRILHCGDQAEKLEWKAKLEN